MWGRCQHQRQGQYTQHTQFNSCAIHMIFLEYMMYTQTNNKTNIHIFAFTKQEETGILISDQLKWKKLTLNKHIHTLHIKYTSVTWLSVSIYILHQTKLQLVTIQYFHIWSLSCCLQYFFHKGLKRREKVLFNLLNYPTQLLLRCFMMSATKIWLCCPQSSVVSSLSKKYERCRLKI